MAESKGQQPVNLQRKRPKREHALGTSLVQASTTATLCEALSFLHFGDRSKFITTCAQFYANVGLRQVQGPLIFDMSIPATIELLIRSSADEDPSGKLFETNVLLPASRARTIQWLASRSQVTVPDIAQWTSVLKEARRVTRLVFDVPDPYADTESTNGDVAVLWHQMLVGIGTHASPLLNEVEIRGLGTSCDFRPDAGNAEEVEQKNQLRRADWITAFGPRWETLRVFKLDLSVSSDGFDYDVLSSDPLPYLAVTPSELRGILNRAIVMERLHLPICFAADAERTTLLDIARAKPAKLRDLSLDCWMTDAGFAEVVINGPGTTDQDFLEFFRHWQTMLTACTELRSMTVRFCGRNEETVEVAVPGSATWTILQNDTSKRCHISLSNLFSGETGNVGAQRHVDLLKLSGVRYIDLLYIAMSGDYTEQQSVLAAAPNLDWKDGPLDMLEFMSPNTTSVLASPQSIGFLVARFPSLHAVMDSGDQVSFHERQQDGKVVPGQFIANFEWNVDIDRIPEYGRGLWEAKRADWRVTKLGAFFKEDRDPTDTELVNIVDAFRSLTSVSFTHLKTPVRTDAALSLTRFPQHLIQTSPDLERIELSLPMGSTETRLWDALAHLTRRKLRHVSVNVGRAQTIGTVATHVLKSLDNLITLHVKAAYGAYEDPSLDGALDAATFFDDLAHRHPNLTDLALECRFWHLDRLPTYAKWPKLRYLKLGWYDVWSVGVDSIDQFIKRHSTVATIDLAYDAEICQDQDTAGVGSDYGPCSLAQETKWRRTWGNVTVTLPMEVPLLMRPDYDPVQDIESKLPWMDIDYKLHESVETLKQFRSSFAELLQSTFVKRHEVARGPTWDKYEIGSTWRLLVGNEIGSTWRLVAGNVNQTVLVNLTQDSVELVPHPSIRSPFEMAIDFPESLRQTIVDEWPELVAIKVVDPTEYLHPFQSLGPSDFEATSWVNSNPDLGAMMYVALRILLPSLKRSHITHWMNMGKDKDNLAFEQRILRFWDFLLYSAKGSLASYLGETALDAKASTQSGGHSQIDDVFASLERQVGITRKTARKFITAIQSQQTFASPSLEFQPRLKRITVNLQGKSRAIEPRVRRRLQTLLNLLGVSGPVEVVFS